MTPAVRWLPRPADYDATLTAMRDFTHGRTADTPDEIWLVEHAPVYTLGQAGKPEHVLAPGDIPLVRSDRGGQVTYHGPGQVVGYGLIDLRRRGLFVKEYVALLEDAVIALLQEYGLSDASRLPGAPGVYVPFDTALLRPEQGSSEAHRDNGHNAPAMPTSESGISSRQDSPQTGEGLNLNGRPMAKIAALGIKVSNGRAYHGVSLNVDMDLRPFLGINPCGYQGLQTIDLASHGVSVSLEQAGADLARLWLERLPPIR